MNNVRTWMEKDLTLLERVRISMRYCEVQVAETTSDGVDGCNQDDEAAFEREHM